jgi:hypothetical protein
VSDGHRSGRHAFRNRKSECQRVRLPGLAGRTLPAPKIDDLLASKENAAGRASFVSPSKILLKFHLHCTELRLAMTVNVHGGLSAVISEQ